MQARPEADIKLYGGAVMDSIWILITVIAVWFFLQAYLLPRLGVST